MKTLVKWLRTSLKYFSSSIRYKIIIPYALLTAVLAVVGVFIVTQLVAGSFEERLKNQLLDAGRVVSDEVVNRERVRLNVERAVANTLGVPEALINRDFSRLNELVSPIIANNRPIDSIVVVDTQAKEVLRLQRESGLNSPVQTDLGSGADFSAWAVVSRVLTDPESDFKDVEMAQDPTSGELIIYTVGPISTSEGAVGAVLVGTYLRKEVEVLRSLALADLTLFDDTGRVIISTLVPDETEAAQAFSFFTPERYQQVIREANRFTFLDEIEGVVARDQNYRLAYGPFLLRGRVFGVYAVALPTNFITSTNDQTRTFLTVIFSVGVVTVFGIGYVVSRRIIQPIVRLVETSQAIAKGDLNQRTGLKLDDEIGILANTFDDMTAELQRLLQIQKEEASKLNAILSSIADGVIVQDMVGSILIMNPAAERILEAISDDLLPLPGLEASEPIEKLPGEEATEFVLNHLTGLEFHETRRIERENRVLSALSAPVVTSDSEHVGSVVVLRDITREVESEKLKDSFVTSVSHELKTPLTAIKGYNELLKMILQLKQSPDNADKRQMSIVETIEKEVTDLDNLIQALLDLSQIDAGVLGVDQEPINLSELIRTEAENWQWEIEGKDLEFELIISDEPIWVKGDWNRLTRVVRDLLKNAYSYTLEGKIEVVVRQENGQVQVDIKDTGVGILEKDQRRLFTRFYRAIHAEGTFEVSGAGLGLYMSKGIIEAHEGGKIWFKSEPYNGSTFSFALPVIDPAMDDLEEETVEYLETQ